MTNHNTVTELSDFHCWAVRNLKFFQRLQRVYGFMGSKGSFWLFLGFCFGALRVLVLIRGYLRVSDGYSGLGIIWDHDAVWVFIVGGGVYIYFGV